MEENNKLYHNMLTKLISGPFLWDRNEVVTIVGTDPDGDRVLARDSQGNQQLIPKTYLNQLPAVRSVMRHISMSSPTWNQSPLKRRVISDPSINVSP